MYTRELYALYLEANKGYPDEATFITRFEKLFAENYSDKKVQDTLSNRISFGINRQLSLLMGIQVLPGVLAPILVFSLLMFPFPAIGAIVGIAISCALVLAVLISIAYDVYDANQNRLFGILQ